MFSGCSDFKSTPLQISQERSFYVGGRDVKSAELSTIQNFDSLGTISVDQVYVHYQIPYGKKQDTDRPGSRLLPDSKDLGDHA